LIAMRTPYPLLIRVAFVATTLLVALGARAALGQADPPGRVARLNYSEGNVTFAPAGDDEWTDAELNRPLLRGDKLWTDKGVRAEVQAGSSVVRMDGRTQLTVLALDDQAVQLSVTQGSLYMRVRNLPEGENFEVDTPNLAYRAAYPGDYRIDVDPLRGVTRVTIHSGTGAVYGEKGEVLPMGGGQQITFKGRALEKVNVQEQPPQDNFDRWAAERNRREDQSVAARYVPREVVGYQLLDASGEWRQDDNYGPVWYPQGMPAGWAPYRSGRWEWMEPWGWTWIDASPWAFATSHYGRWTIIGTRWAWVPGRLGVRPMYAPALVAFVGSGNAPLAINGKPSVAWFPLAPGEAWQPGFRATPLYISSVNANMPPLKEGGYVYQRKPEAITAVALEDFNRGKSSKGNALRVAANMVEDTQVVAPPAMPDNKRKTLQARAPVSAPAPMPPAPPPAPSTASLPAPTPPIQQVTANSAPTLQQQLDARKEAQKQAQMQAQLQAQREREHAAQLEQERALREQQAQADAARRDEQRKAAEQRRIAEKLRAAEQQRIAQQRAAAQQAKAAEAARLAKAEQAERAAEQARREAAAKRAEQARREQVAKREQFERREQLEKRERELQAKRAEAKRVAAAAAAKKEEKARQAVHARQVEQARRAADKDAQVLAQQRAQREAAQKQQALAEQARREQQADEEQQQQKIKAQQRQRPDLRRAPPAAEPEVWQRSIPTLTPGRTS
jgi:DNA segregation ATPase FtsK/SpoIIIE-like protein